MTAAQTLTDDLLDFVESLRDDGYNIGAAQYIHVQNLILLLAARGALPDDPARLRTLIAPIVCDSPERQADLEGRFARWSAQRTVTFDGVEAVQGATKQDALRDDLRRAGKLGTWVRWAVAIVAVAAVLVVVVIVNRPVAEPVIRDAMPVDTTTAVAPLPPAVTGTAEGLDLSAALWLAGAVLLALLIQQLLQYLTARRFLTSRLTTDEPDVARLLSTGSPAACTPPNAGAPKR
jgi:hypothetical protein